VSTVGTGPHRVFRAARAGSHRIKGWTWADWTIGDRHQQYGTLTIDSAGNAHFACVTSAKKGEGAEPWRAGFSLETSNGVRLHAEPPRDGPPMRDGDGGRYRWSFDFTFEASDFDRITRAVQTTTP